MIGHCRKLFPDGLKRMKIFSYILIVPVVLLGISKGYAQKVAVKTNALYGAVAATPNLGLEFGLSPRTTLDLSGGYNWFTPDASNSGHKLVHWLGTAEYRYWLCERFNGHFFGLHALGTQYNIAGHDLRMLFGRGSESYRYEGWGVGCGLSYGYQFFLGNRWSLEATVGAGYVRMRYDKFRCAVCGAKVGTESRNYFGPTKAGITLIFIIK